MSILLAASMRPVSLEEFVGQFKDKNKVGQKKNVDKNTWVCYYLKELSLSKY